MLRVDDAGAGICICSGLGFILRISYSIGGILTASGVRVHTYRSGSGFGDFAGILQASYRYHAYVVLTWLHLLGLICRIEWHEWKPKRQRRPKKAGQ